MAVALDAAHAPSGLAPLRGARLLLFAFAALAAMLAGPAVAGTVQSPGPQGPETGPLREQTWLVPSSRAGVLMVTQVFRPPGEGPFPLAVIGHGSDENARDRARHRVVGFAEITAFLVARGYAVAVPQRPGHGLTRGPYLESQGSCGSPDYVRAGRATAALIGAAISYLSTQPFIREGRTLVVGNSAGGWGAIALAAENPPGVAGVISFAAGRGGRDRNRANHNCAPDRLVAAAAVFGSTARTPTIWLYAANDSYFAPDLSARMSAAFTESGGNAEFHLFPAIDGDGHGLIFTRGATTWRPVVEAFLRRYAR